jgi:5-methyltetrahydrofolate--homocysteine methyltransferase
VTALRDRLLRGPVLVGDGAWGTQLLERGLRPGDPPEVFQLHRPHLLEEIALRYLQAGADLLTTNTFGASPLRLAPAGLLDRTEEINAAAVAVARRAVRAAGRQAWVVGSMGPSGRLLAPLGDVDPAEVNASYRRQAAALASAGADALLVETMVDLEEARIAVRAARAEAPDLPVFATMTFDPTPRGFFTIMGVSVEAAARGLAEAGADAVGANCGHGCAVLEPVVRALRAATTLPLVVQPNAGRPEMRGGVVSYPEGPEEWALGMAHLLEIGLAVAGGCCGTGPDHVRATRAAADAMATAGAAAHSPVA